MGTWRSAMEISFLASFGRPEWWSIALAGFLLRGGIVLVLLPLVTVPTPAQLAVAFSPAINELAFGGLTPAVVFAIVVATVIALAILAVAGLAGAWLDRELLRLAAADDELDLRWSPVATSLREALSVRLTAHLPTLAAFAYATFRLIGATYDELLAPGDVAIPIVLRVLARAPDVAVLLAATWLLGEAVGGVAARLAADGSGFGASLTGGVRRVASRRGLGTLLLMTLVHVAVFAPFLVAVWRAWQQVRDVLFGAFEPLLVGAALLVLVASWILGLAVVGAALAWRSTAWTVEAHPVAQAEAGGARLPQQTAEA